MITYGPCADGQHRIAVDNKVIATIYKDELAAKAAAEMMSGGAIKVMPTVFQAYGKKAKAAPPPPTADLDVLDQSIGKLAKALATGEHDDDLDALWAAEQAGKTRVGALDAIEDRLEEIA